MLSLPEISYNMNINSYTIKSQEALQHCGAMPRQGAAANRAAALAGRPDR